MSCRIRGIGSCLPSRVVPNAEVGALTEIAPERIAALFDVEERRWARGLEGPAPAPGQRCSDLAASAASAALADAELAIGDVDTLVTVSTTPDYLTPTLDYLVATKLGLAGVRTFDLRAACAGVFRAFALVDALTACGATERALIVTAETFSPFFRFGPDVSRNHRLQTVLYADGASAFVVERTAGDAGALAGLTVRLTDGGGLPSPSGFPGMLSALPPEPTSYEHGDYLGTQDFRAVLEHGSRLFWQAGRAVLDAAGRELADCRYVLTHQATGRMHVHAERLGIPPAMLPTNIARVGNTVSASIGILMDELHRAGRLHAGDRLLLVAAESSSWSYGGMLLTWGR
jgi:3-oxoacyl-[acyl-carrier-protein] synthase-3